GGAIGGARAPRARAGAQQGEHARMRLKLATFNCDEKLRTDPEDVAKLVASMDADITALQDTGITSAGVEIFATGKFWDAGYILVAKSQVPRSIHGEYSATEMQKLHRMVVYNKLPGRVVRALMACAIRKSVMPKC